MASNQQWFWLQKKRKAKANSDRQWGLVKRDRTMEMMLNLQKKK
jgi:hypothetical protein